MYNESLSVTIHDMAWHGIALAWQRTYYAKNPLHTFPRNFPVDVEVAYLLWTCYTGKLV